MAHLSANNYLFSQFGKDSVHNINEGHHGLRNPITEDLRMRVNLSNTTEVAILKSICSVAGATGLGTRANSHRLIRCINQSTGSCQLVRHIVRCVISIGSTYVAGLTVLQGEHRINEFRLFHEGMQVMQVRIDCSGLIRYMSSTRGVVAEQAGVDVTDCSVAM